ncbi:hypothetical protein CWO91_00950 [Bradyrhizobium genosp. SA-3]|nr:hypothetical protein CWO91_00950 [Bradyrhizobium genosp. SA-3]
MAGLVPAIHVLARSTKNVDARDKPGHDGSECGAATGALVIYPVFLSPAEMPLIVSWIPRSTCSSGFCARCSFNSST